MQLFRIALALIVLCTPCLATDRTVKVAAVHFEPTEGDVKRNVTDSCSSPERPPAMVRRSSFTQRWLQADIRSSIANKYPGSPNHCQDRRAAPSVPSRKSLEFTWLSGCRKRAQDKSVLQFRGLDRAPRRTHRCVSKAQQSAGIFL
jgi:hypothetical protein